MTTIHRQRPGGSRESQKDKTVYVHCGMDRGAERSTISLYRGTMGITRREYKSQVKVRLNEEGRWAEFVEFRESLKAKGMPSPDAWDTAIAAFPAVEEVEGENPQSAAGRPPKRAPNAEHMRAQSAREKSRRPSSIFEGKTCPAHVSTHWVAANVAISDVKDKDAPSPEAWALLCWVQRNDSNEIEFWKNIYTKLLPSRTQIEAVDRFKDDGRVIIELIGDMERTISEPKDDKAD